DRNVTGVQTCALPILAMDYFMRLPMKVSTATSNFMIGITAAASGRHLLPSRRPPSPHRLAGRPGCAHRRLPRHPARDAAAQCDAPQALPPRDLLSRRLDDPSRVRGALAVMRVEMIVSRVLFWGGLVSI